LFSYASGDFPFPIHVFGDLQFPSFMHVSHAAY